MLDGLMAELPVDLRKLNSSQEFARLLRSLHSNIAKEIAKEDSGVGLALKALFEQLTTKDSQLMNEADFTFLERQLIARTVHPLYERIAKEP